ncbi:MFS transporter [Glacieibacterium megasporae]|uniref:MFS transporter n=1 Tax=Glacieibacterium megasporae TaxID=2835787 RepID=UPI001C1E3CA4|nr:MFS transporter [Polymorphobacter megasporae]UAJ12562.1 MFS transporter [Polymorphobacter megasporae]
MEGLTTGHDGAPGHWRLVIALMLIYTYAFVDRVVLALLVDPIKRDLHATDLQMSLLLGLAFALCYGIFSIPAGHYVDRVNRRRLVAIASVGWALMTIVCGTATSVTQLFIGRAGVGLMEAAITPAAFSLIRDAVPQRSRGLAFSTYALAPVLGSALSLAGGGLLLRMVVGGALADVPLIGSLAPWRTMLIVVGLAGLPFSLLVFAFREPAREHDVGPRRVGMAQGLAEACRYIASHRRLYVPLLIFCGTGAMMSFAYTAWFPTAMARRFALPPQQIAPTLGAISFGVGVCGLLVGGTVMNWLSRRPGAAMLYGTVAVIATATGVAGACLAPALTPAFMIVGLGIFFLGISNPAGATTLSHETPANMIGRVSAVYLLVQTLAGQTLGPLAVATTSEHLFTGPSSIASGLAVVEASCAVVAALCGLVLARHLRAQARSPR